MCCPFFLYYNPCLEIVKSMRDIFLFCSTGVEPAISKMLPRVTTESQTAWDYPAYVSFQCILANSSATSSRKSSSDNFLILSCSRFQNSSFPRFMSKTVWRSVAMTVGDTWWLFMSLLSHTTCDLSSSKYGTHSRTRTYITFTFVACCSSSWAMWAKSDCSRTRFKLLTEINLQSFFGGLDRVRTCISRFSGER